MREVKWNLTSKENENFSFYSELLKFPNFNILEVGLFVFEKIKVLSPWCQMWQWCQNRSKLEKLLYLLCVYVSKNGGTKPNK